MLFQKFLQKAPQKECKSIKTKALYQKAEVKARVELKWNPKHRATEEPQDNQK